MSERPSIDADPVAYWQDSVTWWEDQVTWDRENRWSSGISVVALEHARAALEAARARVALAGEVGDTHGRRVP